MSPNNVNDLASSFVQMAKAFEDLPQVQDSLRASEAECNRLAKTVQDREVAILEYKATIDHQAETIRSLEVARDDAELRFLESDDKLAKLAKVFQVALEAVDTVDRTLTDLTAKPQPEPTPIISEVKPIGGDPTPADVSAVNTSFVADTTAQFGDQSEADPTALMTASQSETATGMPVEPMGSVAGTDPAPTDTPQALRREAV